MITCNDNTNSYWNFYLHIKFLGCSYCVNHSGLFVSHDFSHLKISTMREEEKALRQKLCETEKTKKQLQCDLASRDRTIQQLRAVSSVRSGCVFLAMPFLHPLIFFTFLRNNLTETLSRHSNSTRKPVKVTCLCQFVSCFFSLNNILNRSTSHNKTFF